uniref:uncharacterized protein LOC120342434 n=1 Tax=Styela clava TaxID=7725 RepID=UPI0019395CEA|nr:uncharacterized protein LOC120342434 [Styela clava]
MEATENCTWAPEGSAVTDTQDYWLNDLQAKRQTAFQVISAFFILISSYIVAVLSYRGVKIGPCSGRKCVVKKIEVRYRYLMEAAILSTSVFGLARFLLSGLDCIIEVYGVDICNEANIMKSICSSGSFFSLYYALWLRQRVFYCTPIMQHRTTAFTRFVSATVPYLLTFTAIIIPCMFIFPQTYSLKRFGCVAISTSFSRTYIWVICGGASFLLQICLLFLFAFPLVLYQPESLSFKGSENKKSRVVLRRAFFVTLVCVIVDISIAIIQGTNKLKYNIINPLAFLTKLLVNVISTCMLLNDWQKVLFPFSCRRMDVKALDRPTLPSQLKF